MFCRVIKVAKKFSEEGKDVTFAVSNAHDFNHELTEFGLSFSPDKPVVAARDSKDHKFPMKEDFRLLSLLFLSSCCSDMALFAHYI